MLIKIAPITVAEFADIYLEQHAKPFKKSWKLDEGRNQRYIKPYLGNLCLNEVTHRHVSEMTTEIGREKPFTANRVREQISAMWNLAIAWEYLPDSYRNPTLSRGIEMKLTVKVTLEQLWSDYISIRKLKPKTLKDNKAKLTRCVGDWWDMDILQITKDMVEQRHKELKEKPIEANSAFKILRTLFNFAKFKYEREDGRSLVTRNPVDRLSELRAWYKERPRRRFLPLHKLQPWWIAIATMDNQTTRDWMALILLTGLRLDEAASLRWEDIDLEGGFLTARDTKNGSDHTLPLSTFLWQLLVNRRFFRVNEYVFPGKRGAIHFSSPHKAVEAVRVSIGIHFTIHDLRRTFVVICQRLEIDEFTRKRLLNHSFADVTGKHYSVDDPETLREPMERISQFVLSQCCAHLPLKEAPVAVPKNVVFDYECATTGASMRSS